MNSSGINAPGKPSKTRILTAIDFHTELQAQIHLAQQVGHTSIEINSGELHRKVGGYPGKRHRMSLCCEVMYSLQIARDEVVSKPRKGEYGAALTIRYKLPRTEPITEAP